MKTFAIAALLALMLAGGALAAEQAAETPESPSRGYREEAVLGCYHEEEHVCDCNVTSEECDAKNAAEEVRSRPPGPSRMPRGPRRS